jgi:hypothetical protein
VRGREREGERGGERERERERERENMSVSYKAVSRSYFEAFEVFLKIEAGRGDALLSQHTGG